MEPLPKATLDAHLGLLSTPACLSLSPPPASQQETPSPPTGFIPGGKERKDHAPCRRRRFSARTGVHKSIACLSSTLLIPSERTESARVGARRCSQMKKWWSFPSPSSHMLLLPRLFGDRQHSLTLSLIPKAIASENLPDLQGGLRTAPSPPSACSPGAYSLTHCA